MKNLILTLLVGVPYVASGQVPLTTPQIANRVSPSVVVIDGKTDTGDVLGSGFIISKDGKIVTNLHVIRDMNTASVQTATGEIFDSISVLATDEHLDLAIVQVAGLNLPVAELGNSDTLTIGEPVVIVGSPRGLEGTVTAGILSSVRDLGEGFKVLQTDAAVNPVLRVVQTGAPSTVKKSRGAMIRKSASRASSFARSRARSVRFPSARACAAGRWQSDNLK